MEPPRVDYTHVSKFVTFQISKVVAIERKLLNGILARFTFTRKQYQITISVKCAGFLYIAIMMQLHLHYNQQHLAQ